MLALGVGLGWGQVNGLYGRGRNSLKKHLRMPQARLNNYLRQEIFTCTFLLAQLSALSVLFAGTVLSLSALSFSRFPLNLNANRVLCFFMMI